MVETVGMPSNTRSVRSRGRRSRSAIATLELVLAIPILIVPLLAIVRYGSYYANMEQVALAARLGAEAASRSDLSSGGLAIPPDVLSVVNSQLSLAGITPCQIRLEHNVGGDSVGINANPGATCACDSTNLASPPPGKYVRLSICVQMSELVPRGLNGFGLGLLDGTSVAEASSVFPYTR
jgi:hypothetical protein